MDGMRLYSQCGKNGKENFAHDDIFGKVSHLFEKVNVCSSLLSIPSCSKPCGARLKRTSGDVLTSNGPLATFPVHFFYVAGVPVLCAEMLGSEQFWFVFCVTLVFVNTCGVISHLVVIKWLKVASFIFYHNVCVSQK